MLLKSHLHLPRYRSLGWPFHLSVLGRGVHNLVVIGGGVWQFCFLFVICLRILISKFVFVLSISWRCCCHQLSFLFFSTGIVFRPGVAPARYCPTVSTPRSSWESSICFWFYFCERLEWNKNIRQIAPLKVMIVTWLLLLRGCRPPWPFV